MKKILLVVSFLVCNLVGFGQTKVLTNKEVDSIFTANIKNKLNIKFPLFRVYEYSDHAGKHFLVLAENGHNENGNPKNDSIQGICLKVDNGQLKTDWTFNDHKLKEGNANSEEMSIWFWTKYVSLSDIDNDGLVDPIVIYGTSGSNGTEDGRIKILTYYKGTKRALRHQNSSLDPERKTQVDSAFYDLPTSIQNHVKALMKKMMDDNNAIFPYDWEAAMKKKDLQFDER
ncbi:M949_RS01915 family surface polysaccharide biosynthesis protein [Sporocytophaga myxococcoides]|uniref:M949_RS01915 family surface polysaccharide biosynthesis protein n=1 Tax=Sporocytophaga myxococcoides TaxID=153721 RepID=UPI000419F4C8|nr:hypothetical protein [Sporocytophaga myxococcoides]